MNPGIDCTLRLYLSRAALLVYITSGAVESVCGLVCMPTHSAPCPRTAPAHLGQTLQPVLVLDVVHVLVGRGLFKGGRGGPRGQMEVVCLTTDDGSATARPSYVGGWAGTSEGSSVSISCVWRIILS